MGFTHAVENTGCIIEYALQYCIYAVHVANKRAPVGALF